MVHPDDGIFRIFFKRLSTQAVAKFLLMSVSGDEPHRDRAEATSKKNTPKLIMDEVLVIGSSHTKRAFLTTLLTPPHEKLIYVSI